MTYELPTTPETIHLPAPIHTVDGEYLSTAQVLQRAMVDKPYEYRSWHGIPVLRMVAMADGTYRLGIFGSAHGNLIGGWIRDASGQDPNHSLYLRADNGPMRPEWVELRYSINRGWVLDDVEILDSIEEVSSNGDLNLCERCELDEAQSAMVETWYEYDPETDSRVPDLSKLPFADYWADGEYLCSDHFDGLYPSAYVTGYRYRDEVAIWSDLDDIRNHATETALGTDSVPYGTAPLEPTRADMESWRLATMRVAELARDRFESAQNRALEATYQSFERGYVTRELTIESGVAEKYIELGERIRQDRDAIKN